MRVAEVWSARAKLNDNAHGLLGIRFMAFKLAVASSSGWPPDRNTTPGTAGGTRRCRVCSGHGNKNEYYENINKMVCQDIHY